MSAAPAGDDGFDREKATTALLASPQSFCTRAQRAIGTVERVVDRATGPVYVRKQILHNTLVVAQLRAQRAIFVDDLDDIPDPAPLGVVVMVVSFSAHGVSPAVRDARNQHGLQIVDATCSLVTKVHSEAARFAAGGETPCC